MPKKKKFENVFLSSDDRDDNNVETKKSLEGADENCAQVGENSVKRTKRKKRKRSQEKEILSELSDGFPETVVQIEKEKTAAVTNVNEDMERKELSPNDYISVKRKSKKNRNETSHHEASESCPQNKESSKHFYSKTEEFQNSEAQLSLIRIKADMDSEIGRINAGVGRHQNVEYSDSTRHGTSVKQESFLGENDATEISSDYPEMPPAALEDYTNMPPAALEERDPEIAALHATERLHPHPGFLEGLKDRGMLISFWYMIFVDNIIISTC